MATTLETAEATWDRPRTDQEINSFLGRRMAAFALAEASATDEEAEALAELDSIE